MMRIYKEFGFEAAHVLPSAPKGHPNARVHGHSFRVRVTVEGEPGPETGLVLHFDTLELALDGVREALDHRMLNEVAGLEQPTLERIAIWIWANLVPSVPGLAEVHVSRPSVGEGCVYRGAGL